MDEEHRLTMVALPALPALMQTPPDVKTILWKSPTKVKEALLCPCSRSCASAVEFAYHEVPHEETGFSPFELLYGWPVRCPIVILRGLFSGEDEKHRPVIEHVITIRDRLADVSEIVKVNLLHRKGKIKTWYDKRTRFKEFEPGDELLLLLPSEASKNNADALSRT
ncbi:unnamed protein product [Mytilus coruscus]|uniref:Uncharacterized protein n=1 Tax=Mytilus coruscus TaxID=42192 RepID=A0A6J8DYN5_MYTCO|nr:unnamed protein product [Mytilus coruscus]